MFSTLGDVVEVLRNGVSSKECFFVVRRSHILEDLFECMDAKGFSPSMKLNVSLFIRITYGTICIMGFYKHTLFLCIHDHVIILLYKHHLTMIVVT